MQERRCGKKFGCCPPFGNDSTRRRGLSGQLGCSLAAAGTAGRLNVEAGRGASRSDSIRCPARPPLQRIYCFTVTCARSDLAPSVMPSGISLRVKGTEIDSRSGCCGSDLSASLKSDRRLNLAGTQGRGLLRDARRWTVVPYWLEVEGLAHLSSLESECTRADVGVILRPVGVEIT